MLGYIPPDSAGVTKPWDAEMFLGEYRRLAPAPKSTSCAPAIAANPTTMHTTVVETNLLNPCPPVSNDLSATLRTDARVRASSPAAHSHATECYPISTAV